MHPSKTSSESGNAVLEVITFVLVGQLLVTGWLIQLAEQLDHKTRLQLFAISMARSVSLGRSDLEGILKDDLGLVDSKVQNLGCTGTLVCLEGDDSGMKAVGVSRR